MRKLSVTGCVDWVLGDLPTRHTRHVVTQFDEGRGAVLARNFYNTDFEGRTAFFTSTETPGSHTGDRTEFIGRNRSPAQPEGLLKEKLGGRTGAGMDPCAALQLSVTLAPGEEREVAFIMGAGRTFEDALRLIDHFRSLDACESARSQVWEFWNHTLGTISVETPEPSFNVLANGWLLYQTLACRMWARTGFYQSGGAFGFRDQLQDSMALVHANPAAYRAHLVRAAGGPSLPVTFSTYFPHCGAGCGLPLHFSAALRAY
jgi:cellobiose phosphorylase